MFKYTNILQLRPGLRMIAINSNFCNNLNLWLVPRPRYHLSSNIIRIVIIFIVKIKTINRDPANQLQWLVGQLEEVTFKNNLSNAR